MRTDTSGFRTIVRRVATGSTPFQWQVEREDTLTLVEVSRGRFRSMQEAYEAGESWLRGFLASRPVPKRPSVHFGARRPKDDGNGADEPLTALDFEEDDEGDDEDFKDLEYEDEASAQPGW